ESVALPVGIRFAASICCSFFHLRAIPPRDACLASQSPAKIASRTLFIGRSVAFDRSAGAGPKRRGYRARHAWGCLNRCLRLFHTRTLNSYSRWPRHRDVGGSQSRVPERESATRSNFTQTAPHAQRATRPRPPRLPICGMGRRVTPRVVWLVTSPAAFCVVNEFSLVRKSRRCIAIRPLGNGIGRFIHTDFTDFHGRVMWRIGKSRGRNCRMTSTPG